MVCLAAAAPCVTPVHSPPHACAGGPIALQGAPRPAELKALKRLRWAGDERCYCMGEEGEKAGAGSPDSKYCPGFLPGLAPCTKPAPPPRALRPQHSGTPCFYDPTHNTSGLYEDHSTQRCVYHGMRFPEMVVPLVSFLMREL